MRARGVLPLAAAAILVGVIGGCGAEEVILEATAGITGNCPRPSSVGVEPDPWSVRSLQVSLIEWTGGVPGQVLEQECISNIEGFAIRYPQDALDWFDERGYVARGIPGGAATKVQVVAFLNEDCRMEGEPVGPLMCGLTESELSQSTFAEGDRVRFAFYCTARENVAPFLFCLGVGVGVEE